MSAEVLSLVSDHAPLDFDRIYDAWYPEVVGWIRALGGPSADLEDLAQDVFVVVQRQLPNFDGRNLPGWLYRIAARTVSSHRRRAWFRKIFSRPKEVPLENLPDQELGPLEALERAESARLVERVLSELSDKRRRTFVLFELQGYSGEEIAILEQIPLATVWTRLHHARKDFAARLLQLRQREGR